MCELILCSSKVANLCAVCSSLEGMERLWAEGRNTYRCLEGVQAMMPIVSCTRMTFAKAGNMVEECTFYMIVDFPTCANVHQIGTWCSTTMTGTLLFLLDDTRCLCSRRLRTRPLTRSHTPLHFKYLRQTYGIARRCPKRRRALLTTRTQSMNYAKE